MQRWLANCHRIIMHLGKLASHLFFNALDFCCCHFRCNTPPLTFLQAWKSQNKNPVWSCCLTKNNNGTHFCALLLLHPFLIPIYVTLKFLSYHTFPPLLKKQKRDLEKMISVHDREFRKKKTKNANFKWVHQLYSALVYYFPRHPCRYHIPKIMRLLWHARYGQGSNGAIWPEPGVTLGQPCQSSQIVAAGGNPKKKKEFTTASAPPLLCQPDLKFFFW